MTEPPIAHETVRHTFDSYLAAAEALLLVVSDARTTDKVYSFSGLSLSKILKTGLTLQGDVGDISRRVGLIEGSHAH